LCEGLKRSARWCRSTRSPAEDLRVGQKREPELSPDEAAAGQADGEEQLRLRGELRARLEDAGLDSAEQVLCTQRLAAVREGNDRAQAASNEAPKLVLGLGEPAGCDRRSLRLERERLTRRQRIELDRTLERQAF